MLKDHPEDMKDIHCLTKARSFAYFCLPPILFSAKKTHIPLRFCQTPGDASFHTDLQNHITPAALNQEVLFNSATTESFCKNSIAQLLDVIFVNAKHISFLHILTAQTGLSDVEITFEFTLAAELFKH